MFFGLPAFAQHSEQPKAETNSDLRGQQVLFALTNPDEETFQLERTSNFEYFLLKREDDKEVKRKIDGKEAQNLDKEYASLFIKAMYEIAGYEGKCKKTWLLQMKGDEQKVCKEDDQRHQLFEAFVSTLRKKHSF